MSDFRWRLVPIPEEEAIESDFTFTDLEGLTVLARWNMGEPMDERNVYYRGWWKLYHWYKENEGRKAALGGDDE